MTIKVHKESQLAHEVRLGLVLYGGVSLAIYMNGTTNELFRAVRGRGVYWLIKHFLDADIGVDVASGASAGGINGIFLSFALANGLEFGTCANLWRRDGDLGALLRNLGEVDETVPSVLDSEHYAEVLENGFRVMWQHQVQTKEPELATPTRELDLFVTGTDFYGRFSNEVDATGRVIEVKQHRTLFLLKHRDRVGAKCQLDPRADAGGIRSESESRALPDHSGGFRAFAKLAQITSCFPGAFAPVHVVSPRGQNHDDVGSSPEPTPRDPNREADAKLTAWGKLSGGEHYFVDGGVLDNKPFTTLLDTIFHRPADRRVCRHLLYLEPDPERFSAEKKRNRNDSNRLVQPTFVASVLDSVLRLPSYESISDDLARIAVHNAAIQRFAALVDALSGPAGTKTATSSRGSTSLDEQPLYYRTRLLGIGQRVNALLADVLGLEQSGGASDANGSRAAMRAGEQLQRLLEDFNRLVRDMSEGDPRALLERIDVDFLIRRLMALTYELAGQEGERCRWLWMYVNEELQFLEIIRSELEALVVPAWFRTWARSEAPRDALPGGDELWAEIYERTSRLLAYSDADLPVGAPSHQKLEAIYPRRCSFEKPIPAKASEVGEGRTRLKARLDARRRQLDSADPKRSPDPLAGSAETVLEISAQRLRSLLEQAGCPGFGVEFLPLFEREDAVRYPLELAAEVHQRDEIHVVRLSPYDAQRELSYRRVEDKICGETFGHFGAFLKKSWRSNDLLWGRLDGICRLVETLIEHTHFGGERAEFASQLDRLCRQLEHQEGGPRVFLGKLFPALAQRIKRSGADSLRYPDALDGLVELLRTLPREEASREGLVRKCIEIAQLDALCEDLGNVIEDAAEEQLTWNQIKTDPQSRASGEPRQAGESDSSASAAKFWPTAWEFRPTSTFFNPSLLNLAAGKLAGNALEELSPEALKEFFQTEYSVGTETASSAMPRIVLMNLGARAVALTEGALASSAGKEGETLRKKWLYQAIVSRPVHVLVSLTAFLQSSPHYVRAFVAGSFLYGALAVTANLLWFKALYASDGLARGVAIWIFGILPGTSLLLAWLLWRAGRWQRILVAILIALAIAVGALLAWPQIFLAVCRAC